MNIRGAGFERYLTWAGILPCVGYLAWSAAYSLYFAVSFAYVDGYYDPRPWAFFACLASAASLGTWVAVWHKLVRRGKVRAGPALCVLACSWLVGAMLSGFLPGRAVEFELAVVTGIATAGAGAAIFSRSRRADMSSGPGLFERVVILAGGTLFVLELVLRVWAAIAPSPLTVDLAGDPDAVLNAYKLKPDTPGPYKVNALGYNDEPFRVRKEPGVFRIAALGDSFGVGVVGFDYNVFTVMERILSERFSHERIEVYNFSVACGSPETYLLQYHLEVKRFNPDLLLVMVFVGNDLDSYEERKLLAVPDDLVLQRVIHRGVAALKAYYFSDRVSSSHNGRVGQTAWTPPNLPEDVFLSLERRRLAGLTSSDLERRAAGSLDALKSLIRDSKADVVLAVAPDQVQVDPVLLEEVDPFGKVDRSRLLQAQAVLKRLAKDAGAEFVDLTPALARAEREGRKVYVPRNTHWNELGNTMAAEVLAGALAGIVSGRAGSE